MAEQGGTDIQFQGPPDGIPGGHGGPPNGFTGGMGGPPNGIPGGQGGPPKMGLVDQQFKPLASVEFTILAFAILFYIPSIILYYKNRKHLLIKYRQPNVVLLAAILGAIMSILVPIFRYFEVKCYVNTWIINILVFSCSIITYSRYVRNYFMQRLSIFKLRFGESKNSKQKHYIKMDNSRSPETSSFSQQWDTQSYNTSLITKGTTVSNDDSMDSLGITDPTVYFRKLNEIINRKLIITIVIFPIVFIFMYNIYITISYWDRMVFKCINEDRSVGTPKLVLSIIIITSSIYFFYQAYFKQKWDKEIRVEYSIYILGLLVCNILMQMTVRYKINDDWVRYRMYIFQVFVALVHFMCVIVPLIKIGITKLRNEDVKLTEGEFLVRLSSSSFRAQVKEIATSTFCIENVLFYEAHCDLMNMVISYYQKKANSFGNLINDTYGSSESLQKNMMNLAIYQPFDYVFKPQFDQVYNLYIKEDGIAAVNLKSSTIDTIERQIEYCNYSYLMFSEAIDEVGELLYNNVYPRMRNYS